MRLLLSRISITTSINDDGTKDASWGKRFRTAGSMPLTTDGQDQVPGPPDRLALYEEPVASVDGVERKGAANPYTSRNGYMTSFIDKEGEVSIRLDKPDREQSIEQYRSRISTQYGKNMPEFAVVPDGLLERQDEIRPWFVRSWEWVGTLQPK